MPKKKRDDVKANAMQLRPGEDIIVRFNEPIKILNIDGRKRRSKGVVTPPSVAKRDPWETATFLYADGTEIPPEIALPVIREGFTIRMLNALPPEIRDGLQFLAHHGHTDLVHRWLTELWTPDGVTEETQSAWVAAFGSPGDSDIGDEVC